MYLKWAILRLKTEKFIYRRLHRFNHQQFFKELSKRLIINRHHYFISISIDDLNGSNNAERISTLTFSDYALQTELRMYLHKLSHERLSSSTESKYTLRIALSNHNMYVNTFYMA